MKNVWSGIVAIVETPLTGDLDLPHVFLLTGLVLVSIIGWILILHALSLIHISEPTRP